MAESVISLPWDLYREKLTLGNGIWGSMAESVISLPWDFYREKLTLGNGIWR